MFYALVILEKGYQFKKFCWWCNSKVNSYERVYEIEFKLFCWDLSE